MDVSFTITPDDEVTAQAERGIPPSPLVLGGVSHQLNRRLTPAEVIAFVGRGMTACLVSFGDRGYVAPADVPRAVEELLRELPPGSCGEPTLWMYGRRRSRGSDTRLVVLSVAERLRGARPVPGRGPDGDDGGRPW